MLISKMLLGLNLTIPLQANMAASSNGKMLKEEAMEEPI